MTAIHQMADRIAELEAELDAARARERHALVAGAEALRRIAAATPVGHEDVTKGPSTYTWLCYAASLLMAEAATTPATPLEQELLTMRAREAKLRAALEQTPCHLDCADFPREAAKDAEIASLSAQVQQWRDHVDRCAEIQNVADLYRRDPLAMADAIVRLREDVGALRAEKD